MTCSDSGLTPSSSAACRTRSSTAAACAAGSGPLTLTSVWPDGSRPAGLSVGMGHGRLLRGQLASQRLHARLVIAVSVVAVGDPSACRQNRRGRP